MFKGLLVYIELMERSGKGVSEERLEEMERLFELFGGSGGNEKYEVIGMR